ncbi:MAG: OB-fold nucleic acid binding domain-containing protein [Candidatus Pacearchaeota archaeon]|jgi:replication factor A1
MSINELKSGQGNVNVQGVITEVGDIRVFNKFGKELRVANAILKDDSGTIKLTLWNDESTKYKQGDEIKIENGYVNEFQGELQLTAGKFGKIVLLNSGGAKADVKTETKKQAKLEENEFEEEIPEEESFEEELGEE